MIGSEDRALYVGYRTDNDPEQSRFTRRAVGAVCLAALVIGATITLLMNPFARAVYGVDGTDTFTGYIETNGQPRLVLDQPVARPKGVVPGTPYIELLLVQEFKFGANDAVRALNGVRVTARGNLIAQGANAMLELAATPERADGSAPLKPKPEPTRRAVSLTGEIVDSKCFLGAMKPGLGKSHRSCAALCLAGGIPPAFLVRPESLPGATSEDQEWIALLLDTQGQAITKDLAPFVGYAVRVEGYLEERGPTATPRLLIDPETIRAFSK